MCGDTVVECLSTSGSVVSACRSKFEYVPQCVRDGGLVGACVR